MSKVPKWGYGSKRRIRMIYWSPYQIAGVIALAISLMAFGFVLARLLASLTMDQQQEQEDSPSQSGANSAHSISATLNPVEYSAITTSLARRPTSRLRGEPPQ